MEFILNNHTCGEPREELGEGVASLDLVARSLNCGQFYYNPAWRLESWDRLADRSGSTHASRVRGKHGTAPAEPRPRARYA